MSALLEPETDFIAAACIVIMGWLVWLFVADGNWLWLVLLLGYGHAWARWFPFHAKTRLLLMEHAEIRRQLDIEDDAWLR